LEGEEFPYDAKPLFANRITTTSAGDADLGTYSVPSGKLAIITGVKYASESQNTWFSFGGDLTDFVYLAAAGEGMVAGSPDNPVWTLEGGKSVTTTVLGAGSAVTYSIVLYGRLRDKEFKGVTPQG